jgi:hypothetical protein
MVNLPVVYDGCSYYRTKGRASLDLLARNFKICVLFSKSTKNEYGDGGNPNTFSNHEEHKGH